MVKVIAATSALVACVVDAAKYIDPDDFYSSSFAASDEVQPHESSLVQIGMSAGNDNDITNGGACSGSQCSIRVCCPGTHTYNSIDGVLGGFTEFGDPEFEQVCGDSIENASCATSAECDSFADYQISDFCELGCAANSSDPDAVCEAMGFGSNSKCLKMATAPNVSKWGCYKDSGRFWSTFLNRFVDQCGFGESAQKVLLAAGNEAYVCAHHATPVQPIQNSISAVSRIG